jgi:transcriptional regulator of acetoin/glycerol metabolism
MVLEESSWIGPASFHLDEVSPQEYDSSPAQPSKMPTLSLENAEKAMLLNALQTSGWNQTRAAELLSITRDTLRYKMKKFNLRQIGTSPARIDLT